VIAKPVPFIAQAKFDSKAQQNGILTETKRQATSNDSELNPLSLYMGQKEWGLNKRGGITAKLKCLYKSSENLDVAPHLINVVSWQKILPSGG
jgi:hypothetical protein